MNGNTHVRQRLPAEVRVRQILDAALAEFSARGFINTRIDDIAARAGLSKGGVYTHFQSKKEVFEALLERLRSVSISVLDEHSSLEGEITIERVVGLLAGEFYTLAVSEPIVAMLRLLVAESLHMPHCIGKWQGSTEKAYVGAIGKILAKGIQQGHLRTSVATRTPQLLMAPVAHMFLREAIRTVPTTPRELKQHRETYRQFLVDILTPRA